MNQARQEFQLADGRKLVVYRPIAERDVERLVDFFSSLPRQLRNYLRYDVTNPKLCRRRLEQVDEINHWRLTAELEGRIVADGSMDREPFGWTHHLAQVRAIVQPEMENLGIGTVLLGRLVEIGKAEGIERFYSEVLKNHKDMIRVLEKEGFVYETTRKNYAKDLKGRLHDVIILSNDQSAVWRTLQEHVEELDIKMSNILRGA